MYQEEIKRICTFLASIDIPVEFKILETDTFLPGLTLGPGCIYVDQKLLKYPGDILHEAGHIAVATPHERRVMGSFEQAEDFPEMANEIAAIAWSYAAANAIGLAPELVFHENGYKGASQWHMDLLESGQNPGINLLAYYQMTDHPLAENVNEQTAFPNMRTWLRITEM